MAFNSSSDDKKIFNEINITPLTDIFLVLLIIMMVVAPTFQSQDNSISVPEINSGITIEQKKATVSITKEGVFYLNGSKIDENSLTSDLEKLKPSLEKKEVVVKADAQAKSSLIMKVMNAASQSGYEKLTIAGEPLTKKEQKTLQDNNLDNQNLDKKKNLISSSLETNEPIENIDSYNY